MISLQVTLVSICRDWRLPGDLSINKVSYIAKTISYISYNIFYMLYKIFSLTYEISNIAYRIS